jgi:phytoene dehydrogenase-like protein
MWEAVRDRVGEELIDAVTAYAPNFRRSILEWVVYTPADMERRLGLTAGNIHHLDHSATQLLGDRLFWGGGYRTARRYPASTCAVPGRIPAAR